MAGPAHDIGEDERQKRFDEIMAVYAAMIERIDLAMGALVDGPCDGHPIWLIPGK